MNAITSRTKLAMAIVAASERETAQALHTAGWALRPAFKKVEEVTLADKVRALHDYAIGRVQYEPAETQVDMFTGKTIYQRGEEYRPGGVRVVFGTPEFYELAKGKLDGVLRHRLRAAMKEVGIKLRGPQAMQDMADARKEFYKAREEFDTLMGTDGGVRVVADRLLIGQKVQARSMAKALVGTIFEKHMEVESSNRLLTSQYATDTIQMMMNVLDELRTAAFEAIRQDMSLLQANAILKTKEGKELLEQMAKTKAEQLWRSRFWLAYSLTMGQPVARVYQMTPALLNVAETLEDPMSDDLIGYYDSYERTSMPGLDADGKHVADGSERNLRGVTLGAQQAELAERQQELRMSAILEVMANGCDLDEAKAVWEDGAHVANAFADSFEGITLEELIDAGKIPVNINRAKAVEAKIERNRTLLAEIEEIAALLGKRAKDQDWVLVNAQFDFNEAREEAIKLFTGNRTGRTDARAVAYRLIEDAAANISVI